MVTRENYLQNKLYFIFSTARVSSKGVEPLKYVLAEMGGWPVVEGPNWDSKSFSWTQAIYNNRRIGYSIDYLIDFSVAVDVKNSSWRIIDVRLNLFGDLTGLLQSYLRFKSSNFQQFDGLKY